jgi:hypothetical protein
MRDVNRPVVRLCNMMDFQNLTAALIVMIYLLDTSDHSQLRHAVTETHPSFQPDQSDITSAPRTPGFETSNDTGFEDAQAWSGFGEYWTSAVDFSLLDNWNWSLNESS